MKSLGLVRYALCICMAATLLVGCGGSQPPIGAPGAVPQSRAIATHAERGRSWILPEARRGALLYISNASLNVYVYSYPRGQHVGTLSVSYEPHGECVDASGDIFIPANSTSSQNPGIVYEYAHGGTNPIATLNDPGLPLGCSVDPTTGNLAVSNTYDTSNPYNAQNGSIAIYAAAQGQPTMYYSSQFGMGLCGYDDKGTLYLTGGTGNTRQVQLLRLRKGSGSFELIRVNKKIYYGLFLAPSVQWDGQYMTVSSVLKRSAYFGQKGRGTVFVYRLAISGSSATVIGITKLVSNRNIHGGQSWIQGNTIIGNDPTYRTVSLWPYPEGGKPDRIIKGSFNYGFFWGAAVSLAPGAKPHSIHNAKEQRR
jgi:hypothetical protein